MLLLQTQLVTIFHMHRVPICRNSLQVHANSSRIKGASRPPLSVLYVGSTISTHQQVGCRVSSCAVEVGRSLQGHWARGSHTGRVVGLLLQYETAARFPRVCTHTPVWPVLRYIHTAVHPYGYPSVHSCVHPGTARTYSCRYL